MKRLALMTLLILASQTAFADDSPIVDIKQTTCHTFLNDKLVSQSPCTLKKVFNGYDGIYRYLTIGEDNYLFRDIMDTQGARPVYHANGKPSFPAIAITPYLRHSKTLQILSDDELKNTNDVLYCQKSQNGTLDICYR